MFTGDRLVGRCANYKLVAAEMRVDILTLRSGLVAASGVVGDCRAGGGLSDPADGLLLCPSRKSLKPVGTCITDCGASSWESDRVRAGSCVTIL